MLRWALLAVVVTLSCVCADQTVSVSAADASVAAAVASESSAAAGVGAQAHATSEAEALASTEAEAERKKKKKDAKKKSKKDKKKKLRRYVGGDILFNRAMNVRGVMAAGSIIANNATVQGTLITRQLKTKRVKAHTMSVGELKTTRLSSPTGTIVIEGDLLITHSRGLEYTPKDASKPAKKQKKGKGKGKGKADAAKKAAKGASFLAEEVIVNGVKQWALVRHDHFQTPDTHARLAFGGFE